MPLTPFPTRNPDGDEVDDTDVDEVEETDVAEEEEGTGTQVAEATVPIVSTFSLSSIVLQNLTYSMVRPCLTEPKIQHGQTMFDRDYRKLQVATRAFSEVKSW